MRLYLPVILAGVLCSGPARLLHADEETSPEPLVDVHISTVKSMSLQRELTFYGTVVPEQATEARHAASASVAASIAGLVTTVPAIAGMVVHRDEVLVQLDSRQADAAVQRASASLKQAKATYSRQQKLARLDDTSHKKLEQAEQQLAQAKATLKEARTQRALLDIKAPLDGIVLQVNVRPGEAVTAGTMVVEIQDVDRLVAEVQVPASYLEEVQTGQQAAVQTTGKDTQGKVSFIGMRINPATGTAPVRITLPATSGLYSGQFVRARVIVETHTGLVVPVSAVRHQPDGSGLVAVITGNRVKLQTVKPGIEDDGQVEITGKDIREGLQVVTREVYGLPDNARIRIIGR